MTKGKRPWPWAAFILASAFSLLLLASVSRLTRSAECIQLQNLKQKIPQCGSATLISLLWQREHCDLRLGVWQ